MPDTGLLQSLDYGSGTTVNTCAGKVTAGNLNGDAAPVHRQGIGAQDNVVGGPIPIGGNATISLQGATLPGYAIRTSFTNPSLTAFSVIGGTSGGKRKQTGCLINSMTLHCAVGEPLTAAIEWFGLTDSPDATAQLAYDTGSTWEWFTATAAIAGSSALQCTSWDVALKNNLEYIYTLDGKTTNQMRWPDAIKVGSQDVEVTTDLLAPQIGTTFSDLLADSLATNNSMTFTLVGGASGTTTLTVALANLSRASMPIPFVVAGGLVTYAVKWTSKNDSAVLTIT